MNGYLDDLAWAAADALVSVMMTDSWETVKHRFAVVVGHERPSRRKRARGNLRSRRHRPAFCFRVNVLLREIFKVGVAGVQTRVASVKILYERVKLFVTHQRMKHVKYDRALILHDRSILARVRFQLSGFCDSGRGFIHKRAGCIIFHYTIY